jgi:hypothetical protein
MKPENRKLKIIQVQQGPGGGSGDQDLTGYATEIWVQEQLDNFDNGINGTLNYVAKFTSPSTIGDGILYDTGTRIGLFTNNPLFDFHLNKSVNANLELVAQHQLPNRYATNNVLTDVSGCSIASFGSTYPEQQGSRWAGRSGLYINTGRPNRTLNLWIGTRTILNSLETGQTAIGQADPQAWLHVQGNLMIDSVVNKVGDILTVDANGLVGRRTLAQILEGVEGGGGTPRDAGVGLSLNGNNIQLGDNETLFFTPSNPSIDDYNGEFNLQGLLRNYQYFDYQNGRDAEVYFDSGIKNNEPSFYHDIYRKNSNGDNLNALINSNIDSISSNVRLTTNLFATLYKNTFISSFTQSDRVSTAIGVSGEFVDGKNGDLSITLSRREGQIARMIVKDTIDNKGLEYDGNYEPNFTPRSLITKQYVDSAIAGLGSGGSVNPRDAGAGLSLEGNNIQLGDNVGVTYTNKELLRINIEKTINPSSYGSFEINSNNSTFFPNSLAEKLYLYNAQHATDDYQLERYSIVSDNRAYFINELRKNNNKIRNTLLTDIDSPSNRTITSIGTYMEYGTEWWETVDAGIVVESNGDINRSGISLSVSRGVTSSSTLLAGLNIGRSGSAAFDIILTDQINNRGVRYAGDYELNFTARSLVTKQYVDNAIAGLVVDEISPRDAGVGLSLDGNNIQFGDGDAINYDPSFSLELGFYDPEWEDPKNGFHGFGRDYFYSSFGASYDEEEFTINSGANINQGRSRNSNEVKYRNKGAVKSLIESTITNETGDIGDNIDFAKIENNISHWMSSNNTNIFDIDRGYNSIARVTPNINLTKQYSYSVYGNANIESNVTDIGANIILSTQTNERTGPNTGINLGTQSIKIGSDLSDGVNIGSIVITDSINNKGAVYNGDYEPNFTARSLVTKQYVDDLVFESGSGVDLTDYINNTTDTFTGTPKVSHIVTLTQTEYDAITTKNVNTLYIIEEQA